jgi:hypothetical protein
MRVRSTSSRCAVAGTLAAITLFALGISACGSGSGSGTGGGGGSSSGVTPSISTICTLVPSSQVAAVAKDKVVNTTNTQVQSSDPASYLCSYNLDSGNNVQVEVEVTGSSSAFNANELGLEGGGAYTVTPVSGIGDKAAASTQGIVVLTSEYNIEITNVPDEQPPYAGDKTLAEFVVKALS